MDNLGLFLVPGLETARAECAPGGVSQLKTWLTQNQCPKELKFLDSTTQQQQLYIVYQCQTDETVRNCKTGTQHKRSENGMCVLLCFVICSRPSCSLYPTSLPTGTSHWVIAGHVTAT